jgi:hypothetical protein
MQINKETTTETSQPVKLPFYLLDSANAIKCTIDATKVIEALQRLYDTSFDLNIYKDSIGNIMFHLHEHEKKKMPIDTGYYHQSDPGIIIQSDPPKLSTRLIA